MQTQFDYIFDTNLDFDSACETIFDWQMEHNSVYRRFVENLGGSGARRPMLPVEAFRDARIYAAGAHESELFFLSSGTSTSIRSRHEVAFSSVYRKSILAGMKLFYPLENMVVLGYTPGYNENPNSSLIWMINALIDNDSSGLSRFLNVGEPISQKLIDEISSRDLRVLLFGAAFGLADLAEDNTITLPEDSIIMETGGMKTYRREISREELHFLLSEGFGIQVEDIHSEYGMTELLSQSYSSADGWFTSPPWVRVSVRNALNPLEEMPDGEEGLIGVVDLANWASCPFILTGDRGVRRWDGGFKVLGRWSQFHLRGCNFLMDAER